MFSSILSFIFTNIDALVAGAVGALMLHGVGAAAVGSMTAVSKVKAGVAHVRAFAAAAVKVAEAAKAEAEKAAAPAPVAPAAPEAPAAH